MDQTTGSSSSKRAKRWTASQIVVSNIPSMLTYLLGIWIMFHLGVLIGILYIVFVVMELVLFMRFVCIYCPTYDSVHCPSGYGRVAAKLFKKGCVSEFRSMFNRFIPILSLVWVIPVIGGILLLVGDFSLYYIGLFISFIIVGYVVLPFFHRHFECRDCPNRVNCPWGK